MRTTRSVSKRGGITLPAKLRHAAGIRSDDVVTVEAIPDGILIRPAVTLPLEMYAKPRVAEFDEQEAELAGAMSRSPHRRP